MNVNRAARLLASGALALLVAAAAPAPDDGVRTLLGRMTLEEKMALIRGEFEPEATNQGQPGFLAGVPRLRIPPLRMADGPPGVLTRIPSPALTATMGLAATFSREDARLNGVVIGDEANRLGIDVALQPFVNLDRDITYARGYNTYGEDPMLSGAIGAGLIEGIQSRGVMAQVKHFVGYDTDGADVIIDPQTLHEVYLAPFDDAIRAGVASIMCSYNRINGPYACDSKEMLVDVLRHEMGFSGFVTSDWGAVHDYDYLAHGLDMEMPGRLQSGSVFTLFMRSYFETVPPSALPAPSAAVIPDFFTGGIPEEPAVRRSAGGLPPLPDNYRNLSDAMRQGMVTDAMIDTAAGRVLGQMMRFGYFDGRRDRLIKTASGVDVASVIRKTAADAAVLLKNDGNILPLANRQTIALIGPGAAQVVAVGRPGERSVGLVARQVGPYDALRRTMRDADFRLAIANDMTGAVVPAAVLTGEDGAPGLRHSIGGKSAGIDRQIAFTGVKALPAKSNHVWEGVLTVPSSGRYILAIQTLGTRGVLIVDGKRERATSGFTGGWHGDVVHAGQDDVLPTRDGLNNARAAIDLAAGVHKIRIEANADVSGEPVQVRFVWITPEEQSATFVAAVAAAKSATTAVVFVWSRGAPVFALPGDQDKLVEAVAAANPNTVVVLNVSQPVAMPWIGKVKGVVQMWWPGDEGGWATADILSGRRNPAGRLPFTWAMRLEDYAATNPNYPERSGKGVDGKVRFSEGVDIGYRWFDHNHIAPLFPFGYGLSYTSFRYSDLSVTKTADGGLDAHFNMKNVGGADGEEVPQIYLSAPVKAMPGVQFAGRALAGFDRVFLKAGETRAVTIHVDRRRTQYWSAAAKSWIDAAKTRTLSVGPSSQKLRLQTELR